MEQIKILGISGSPRKGNTEILVKLALEAAEENGNVSTEFISLREKPVKPCIADYACTKKGTLKKPCPTIDDDFGNEIMAKMVNADGFIIGCPVYFGGVTAQLKALMDRSMALEMKCWALRNKVAGVLTIAHHRTGGQEHTIFDMIRWLMLQDMIVVGTGVERPEKTVGCFWGGSVTQGFPFPKASATVEGKKACLEDEIGLNSIRATARRVVDMTRIVKSGINTIDEGDLYTKWHPDKGVHSWANLVQGK